jgi:hypothetical protein
LAVGVKRCTRLANAGRYPKSSGIVAGTGAIDNLEGIRASETDSPCAAGDTIRGAGYTNTVIEIETWLADATGAEVTLDGVDAFSATGRRSITGEAGGVRAGACVVDKGKPLGAVGAASGRSVAREAGWRAGLAFTTIHEIALCAVYAGSDSQS